MIETSLLVLCWEGMMVKFSRRLSLRSVFVVVTALSLYFGSYVALLRPVVVIEESTVTLIGGGVQVEPRYALDHPLVNWLFYPAYLLDYSARTSYWTGLYPQAGSLGYDGRHSLFLHFLVPCNCSAGTI